MHRNVMIVLFSLKFGPQIANIILLKNLIRMTPYFLFKLISLSPPISTKLKPSIENFDNKLFKWISKFEISIIGERQKTKI